MKANGNTDIVTLNASSTVDESVVGSIKSSILPPVKTFKEYLDRYQSAKKSRAYPMRLQFLVDTPSKDNFRKVINPALAAIDTNQTKPKDEKDPTPSKTLERTSTFVNLADNVVQPTVESVKSSLVGIIPMGYKELNLLSNHVATLASQLRVQSFEEKQDDRLVLDTAMADFQTTRQMKKYQSIVKLLDEDEESIDEVTEIGKVENAQFPGLDAADLLPEINPRRCLLNALTQCMQTEQSAKNWKRSLLSPLCIDITKHYFWYVWFQHWRETDQETISVFFDRISVKFVNLFLNTRSKSKDEFLYHLPYILSNATFNIFCQLFPSSLQQFNLQFQEKLCSDIIHMINGICPPVLPCQTWSHEVELQQAPQIEDIEDQKHKQLINQLTSPDSLDVPINITSQTAKKNETVKVQQKLSKLDSTPFGHLNKSTISNFDVYQNSPALVQYLKYFGGGEKKTINISRHEMIKEVISDKTVTYRQLVRESTKGSRKRYNNYKSLQDEISRERAKLIHDNNTFIAREHSRLAKLLSKPQAVKLQADHILDMHAAKAKSLVQSTKNTPALGRVPINLEA
ncbi:hypothetical protein BC833DRAFT_618555 [Globomyces pollinis-pini]|nr:hypothetical protein BC833DRAFT_618555 [Globomyces pollinis-pini]